MTKSIFDIDKNMKNSDINISYDDNFAYYDLNNDYLMGRGFRNGFKRLPDDVFVSENVSTLMRHPSGFNIIFSTDSKNISVYAKLVGAAYMSHMTAVGTIGFSLYVKNNGKWAFLGATKVNNMEYTSKIATNLDKKMRTYRLYFPLYQGLEEAKLITDKDSKLKFEKYDMENLVIYGTSISQGGCATRAGMDYGSILGRMLNVNVINLGFSGSCKIEKEMTDILNRIKFRYLILELESNSPSPSHMKERLTYMLENLKNKENIDIYLISHFADTEVLVKKDLRRYRDEFKALQASFKGVTFLDGEKLTKELGYEGTVDGVHLTDLGFYHLAKKLAKIIKGKKHV